MLVHEISDWVYNEMRKLEKVANERGEWRPYDLGKYHAFQETLVKMGYENLVI